MQAYENINSCCGCSACMNICPTKAITMVADKEGFLYPKTDESICINCGLCRKTCSFKDYDKVVGNFETPVVYAAIHKNEAVRLGSSSGGMFVAISDYVLLNGGIVYGACFDKSFKVNHQKAETFEQRDQFKGSKYVQSDLGDIFTDIKNELKSNRFILFTGTPCQTAGLKSYLGKVDTNSLYLCDIVCHGTPSPLIWKEHLSFLETKFKDKIKSINFKDKILGWRDSSFRVKMDKTEYLKSNAKEYYFQLFNQNYSLRPACYNCKFTNFNRPSDITIADFWGIENSKPHFDDNKGVSLVLVNSEKGKKLFENISNSIIFEESNTKESIQPNLKNPSPVSPKRKQFWNDYFNKGYIYVLKKYTRYGFVNKIKTNVSKTLIALGFGKLYKKIKK